MPATDSKLTLMEDSHHALEEQEGSLTNIPSSVSPTTAVSSPLLDPKTKKPNFPSQMMVEKKAVSMTSNDCSLSLCSPAEASPAKPAAASPTRSEVTVETSPATSHIAAASGSLKCTETSIVNISESPLVLSELPSTTFGSPDLKNDFPTVLTFKGVSVTLENNSVWKQFYSCGTEMILTKPGRRMFPYCRYRLSGLDPDRLYTLVLSIVPSDQYRYRWSTYKWEVNGPAEHQAQGLIRAFSHHYSPSRGSDWMGTLVSFYKLKLTNFSQDHAGHIILHSMHRYIPRLHVIPVPDGDILTPDQPVVMGPESMTFTFPQTEFMAVTTYQNFRITQLKINHNPFAKGFREDGNNSRLQRFTTEAQPVGETQPPISKAAELSENKEKIVDLNTKKHNVSASLPNEQETRLVLKPIMSGPSNKDEPYVPCIRGKHALGELVLVQKRPLVEPHEETHSVSITPKVQQDFTVMISPTSIPGSSPGYRKRRKRINKRWANSRGRDWKAAVTSPMLVQSTSTVAMQPELDDVEGLLFVSFTSKQALEVHVRDKPAKSTPSASPVSLTPTQFKDRVELIPETDEEKIARLEAILLQDLGVFKHNQVIHPVLQEVGLKLSSLDQTKSIDLKYVGVNLPLPPPDLPEQGNATARSPVDEGLSFISRTGKTSDMTKIKGWKNKFIRSKETTSSNCDGSQKNLSAFCSNMLDEYLENEAQNICERAAAFSTNPEDTVAYQLPVKSSSYVKTLDSVLKHRKATSKFPVGANRPCPLSHKPRLYSALASPVPSVARSATPDQAEAQSQQLASTQPGAQGLSTYQTGTSPRPAGSFGQSQGMTHRPSGLTKLQLKLLQMEFEAVSQGLDRTQLTSDRLSVALSVVLTKQMLPSQVLKVAQHPTCKTTVPECGQEFCALGCVCSSLQHLNRGPLHCRRPECMFGCACFKRKIVKQMSAGKSEQQIQPVYSMTNNEHVVQLCPGSHSNKLWNHSINDVDPEALLTPKRAPLYVAPIKVLKRISVPRPTQPIREEDKDPVYKYLESMMTCARVREFNSKPPPEISIEPKILHTSTPNTTAKPLKTTTDNLLTNYHRPLLTAVRKTAKWTNDEKDAKKQIEIQSACQWAKDREMVLEALCLRMNQNRLSRRFWVGPYCIRPVARIFMRKPSGSIVTYRVHISKSLKTSDYDEEDSDDSDEEKQVHKSFDEDMDAEEDVGKNDYSDTRVGVTPFLSGVLSAGRLRARTKPVGCQAYGLIQVNGKAYNQARLLLGNMGSLHPANRLAAFVTGRLHPPGGISLPKSNPTNKITTPGTVHMKPAGTVVPPVKIAKKTNDVKTPTQPPAPLIQPDSWRKGSINLPQHSQNPSTINPFVAGPRISVSPFQNSSTSSPVSLTVSQSLKTPSFLGQSGTYSFRICPPANQGPRGQNLQGVTLPGGFTLIQLPKHGADGASSQCVNTTDVEGVDNARPQNDALFNFGDTGANWPSLDAFTGAKDLSSSKSVEAGISPQLDYNRKVESNLDIGSEDLSSDSSDYCGEGDEDDEVVDIETVEEVKQEVAIAKLKEAISRAQKDSRDSSDGFASCRELNVQGQTGREHESKNNRRRNNHTKLERQRRSEQRILFDRLQVVLRSDPRAPRLRLLSLAQKEIKHLVETSRHLEEKKRRLIRMQSVYVKELSLLSGKSNKMIKQKLAEICERQRIREKKQEWSPFFSNLLQSRAALLQATASQSKHQPTPLLQPDFYTAPSQANPPIKALNEMMSVLRSNLQSPPAQSTPQTPTPQSVCSLTQAKAPAPSQPDAQHPIKSEVQQEPPGVPAQVSMPNSHKECSVAATHQVTAAQDGASPASSTPNSSKLPVQHPKPFPLPLIRSKTGRIILPSSLKPLGQGFYTLVVMEAKQKEEKGEDSSLANMQAPDVNSSQNQDKSFSECDHLSDSESSRILEEDKAAKSPNSKPECSGVKAPLAELALINKSIFVPSVAQQAVENRQEESTTLGLNKTMATACLSFTCVKQTPTSVEPDPSPPVVRRRRGRPRKHPITPVSANEKPTVAEDASKSVCERETSILVCLERQIENIALEVTKTQVGNSPGMVSDDPVPVKRGRGRPPKKKCAQPWSSPVLRAGRSPSKSNEDSPVRLSQSPRSKSMGSPSTTTLLGDINSSRPLTRGALGKDFPSAKKRSWIDVEKDLEPELESESESESESE
ncbi:MAX gene-associated protein [Etheostoma cragini]|uniref:MAX gene-associated protein n=1 Tax=Etheostoma cragini TaxID=417921 RepID=UPI00155E2ED6|nr:MAX gene-associated protein [Etheostoma cragini]XP_034756131.1 MAX gene-associated protein [Etheostoma cragini]